MFSLLFSRDRSKSFISKLSWGIAILIIATSALYYGSILIRYINGYGLENVLRDYSSIAQLLYFLICFSQPILLPLPEALTISAGSAVFGPYIASILGFTGTLLGIIVMYFIAKTGGQKLVSKLVKDKHLAKYQEYVGKNETIILVILFIIPVLPDEIICVGAGIGGVSFRRFLLIATISKVITAFLLAFSVHFATIASLSRFQLMLVGVAIIAIVYAITLVTKKYLIKGRKNPSNEK